MATPTIHATPIADQLAVTYRCCNGHSDIRFYRAGPVPPEVVCCVCGWPALIPVEEYRRHERLMTKLAEWEM